METQFSNDFEIETPTRHDLIACNPAALDALVLGADEFELLSALAELDGNGAAALASVVL
jgi:hypothetical protein